MQDKPKRLDDWFATAALANRARERERQSNPMSAAWGRAWRKDDVVTSLQKLRDAVRNIVRIHGVPPQCRVELAVAGQQGTGAAGFDDWPTSFTRPFILLDKRIFELCAPEEAA